MTREEAIKILDRRTTIPDDDCSWGEINEAIDMAIKALEQEPILDKVRAEIEALYMNLTYKENSIYKASWGLRKAMDIIDKYRAESEDKE